ncbi:unnamed protein product [Ectocarpus sp. 12 AP-2014]
MVSTDREALVSLFRSTGEAGWIRRDNWDTDADLATWNGVTVNDQGRVVNLDLKYNNLQGSIPPELRKLAALRELDLHGNQLTGRIPKELGDLTELKEVTLYHNNLTGRIPEEMGNLKALTHLLLNHNSLEGLYVGSTTVLVPQNSVAFHPLVGGNDLLESVSQREMSPFWLYRCADVASTIPKELKELRLHNLT